MLRPATPLAIVFFIAFVILLLSTLSTPIIQAIPLASNGGYNFGVFGYCNTADGTCSGVSIGYGLPSGLSNNNFDLSQNTRSSLLAILIVHPIAAFLVLICFILAIAAHFHSPSSSPRFLLGLLILTIPTLIVTLLAFLVDILLFVPHVAWGGWIVLAAVILIVASSVLTCAMRRTLVSRKARQMRIQENADMNGENYYNNLANTRMMADAANVEQQQQRHVSQLPRADSPPPMMTGANGAFDKDTAQYASYEMQQSRSRDDEPVDDRVPLNPARDPSIRSVGSNGRRTPYGMAETPPPMPRPSMDSQGRMRRPTRDQYGNPIMPPDLPPQGMMRRSSQESMGSNLSYGSRGRGRGRGYYGGPPPGRGGFPPSRGGYGPRGGMRGPPPPGWRGRGGGPPPNMRGGPRGPPPPGYMGGEHPYYAVAGGAAAGAAIGAGAIAMRSRSQSREGRPPQDLHNAPPPPELPAGMPIGQAVEMDERTGFAVSELPSQSNYGLRDSDADVHGMVGLQQGQEIEQTRVTDGRSPTSEYSEHVPYVPPRQQWEPPVPEHQIATATSPAHESPYQVSPPLMQGPPSGIGHARSGSEPYYEDVDPRFAVEEPSDDGFARDSALPNVLTPGGHINPAPTPGSFINSHVPGGFPRTPGNAATSGYGFPNPNISRMQAQHPQHDLGYLHPKYASGGGLSPNDSGSPGDHSSIEQDGGHGEGGSERASEASHFTSISERPVNPNWRPDGAMSAGTPPPLSGNSPQRRQQDAILGANPDFSIPGVGAGRGGRQRSGSRAATGNVGGGFTPGGRYPGDII